MENQRRVALPSPRSKDNRDAGLNLLKLKSRLKRKTPKKNGSAENVDEDGESSNITDMSSVGTEMRQALARTAALKLRRKKTSHASLRSPPPQTMTPSKRNIVSSPYNRISQGMIKVYEASPKLPVPKIRSYQQTAVQDSPPGELLTEEPLNGRPPMSTKQSRSYEQSIVQDSPLGEMTPEETIQPRQLIPPSVEDSPPEKPVSIDQPEKKISILEVSNSIDNDKVEVSPKLEPPKVFNLDVDEEGERRGLPPQVSTPSASEREIAQPVMPQQTRYLDIPKPERVDRPSFVRKQKFWTIIFLLVQIGLYMNYPDLLGAVLSAFVLVSEESILICKDKLGIEPNVIEKVTKVEVEVEVKPEQKIIVKNITDSSQITHAIEDLNGWKEEFTSTVNLKDGKSTTMRRQLEDIESSLSRRRKSLEEWNAALKDAEEEIRQLVASPPQNVMKNFIEYDVAEAFEKLHESSKIAVETEIISADVPMWEIVPTASTSNCLPESSSSAKNDPIVTTYEISERINNLKEDALQQVHGATKDRMIKEIMKVRIEAELEVLGVPEDNIERDLDADDEEEEGGLLIGITKEEGRKIISEGVNNHLAEKIGPSDFSSLFNGAELIHTGPRATSPSLVESLPLFNRLMAYTRLRHYGYGVEAALTPTVPEDAIGQCWAFENVSNSKSSSWRNAYEKDRTNGSFASLSIRFSSAVSPKRVVIEHVKSQGKPLSAIRDFRIIGYEDEDALGSPVNLGKFQYSHAGDPSQDFFLSATDDEIRSVTLAIDSAYRSDFACLYRFRVTED
eukprot:CAMPEP_0194204040 /NCGR_PEP_ID=MMETSP0156-20130528/3666_1 /TAXON_ID=33649 /ORGANISM="Thalassionema nitzschioides, Strain L26-B" /LENGTH=789 /DNA_ID=CAMNT_0038929943 /DNA_START=103 /DNA_END=2472 /DNA_ORIENTATION=-